MTPLRADEEGRRNEGDERGKDRGEEERSCENTKEGKKEGRNDQPKFLFFTCFMRLSLTINKVGRKKRRGSWSRVWSGPRGCLRPSSHPRLPVSSSSAKWVEGKRGERAVHARTRTPDTSCPRHRGHPPALISQPIRKAAAMRNELRAQKFLKRHDTMFLSQMRMPRLAAPLNLYPRRPLVISYKA